jgi:hypothetical protein
VHAQPFARAAYVPCIVVCLSIYSFASLEETILFGIRGCVQERHSNCI